MNDPARLTDRELFEAVSRGDARALAVLASRHARGLYDFALRGTLDEQQAASVLTAVFQRVRMAGNDVPSQIDFRTWLYSLCLVEVLAVSNQARTARISTEDARFFQRTTDLDVDVAHWAWQAARALPTRDYCVLDLTLRRGLTPEEVAEAASLTRSNLYASIGRARGAFEETFAAMLLFEYGRDACPELDEMVESSPGDSLRPALRHQIVEHSDDCEACRRTLDSLPPAASVYVSLADTELPEPLLRYILGDTSPVQEPASTSPVNPTATSAAFAEGAAMLEPAPGQREVESVGEGQPRGESNDAEEALFDEAGEDDEAAEEADFEDNEDEDENLDEDSASAEEEETDFEFGIPPAPVVAGATNRLTREPEAAPVRPIQREEPPYDSRESVGDRVVSWVERARGQPLMWTYALLGVAAVFAIYLGVVVAASLQTGGGDSGAMPLDAQSGISTARKIDCGSTPIQMDAGTSTVVSFDKSALDGYQIKTLSYSPDSEFAKFGDVEASLQDPFSILFVAKPQQTLDARTDQYQLNIQWERGSELASSTCQLLVNVAP